jgi:hypothetical protein
MEFLNHPLVGSFGSYTWYPKEFYSWVELLIGLILGFYLPLMSRARNDDCFAAFWALGNNLFRWHTVFDNKNPRNFDSLSDWIEFLLVPGMTGYQIFRTNR